MHPGMWSLLGMLLAVFAILFLAWWVTSQIARHGVAAWPGLAEAQPGGEFCVLRQIPVSRTERLLLVRLNQRCLLVGAAQGGLTLLAELTAEEAKPWLEGQPKAAGGAKGFGRFLH